jgi:phospholipid/cholesterol/gamma-HCH transport system permease protein
LPGDLGTKMSVEIEQRQSRAPQITTERVNEALHARLSGAWTAKEAPAIERCVSELAKLESSVAIEIDLASVDQIDTIGAWLIDHALDDLRRGGRKVNLIHVKPKQQTLLDEVRAHGLHIAPGRNREPARSEELEFLVEIGKGISTFGEGLFAALSFLGEVVAAATRLVNWRRHFRAPAFVHQMELIVLRGAPIIILISFVVGSIIAQQGIFQLRRFDAADFVVDLIGILTLRELGVLLASIMVAGRSGSSFTAELGAMKMREEIDALLVMGFDPIDVLILPRLLALAIGLPMLVFIGDISSLAGGGLVAWLYQGISPHAFLTKLQAAISLHSFLAGIIKAPFMAVAICMIASIEGLAVRGSTEDLGRHVTASVVKAIFTVIVVDGLFAIFYAAIDY